MEHEANSIEEAFEHIYETSKAFHERLEALEADHQTMTREVQHIKAELKKIGPWLHTHEDEEEEVEDGSSRNP